MKITILAGTNRPGSQTLRVARVFEKKYQALGAQTTLLDLQELPAELFRPEAYAQKPASFARFNDAVLNCDGLLVVTPEYNGGFPGVLKLFIDHLKFPESFERRAVAFVGLAAGMWGALRPVEQLEAIFRYRNAFLFNERIFLPRIEGQLDAQDAFTSPDIAKLADSQTRNFLEFCRRLKV